MTSNPKYPNITVPLSENDGNAFMVLGLVGKALRRGGVAHEEIATFRTEAISGDYDHLLSTAMRWVTVE